MRVVGVAVVAGDPVGGGDDVDAGLEDLLVEVDVGEDAVEGHAVGLRGDDLLDGAGGDHADRVDAHDLAGVAADLVRRVAVEADQLEVGLLADPLDHLAADVAGGDLEHAEGGHVESAFLCCVNFGGAATDTVGIELPGPVAKLR